jgi:mannan endo-1,4-beta-mannosidase
MLVVLPPKIYKNIFLIAASCMMLFHNRFSLAQTLVTTVEAESGTRAGGLTIATANAGYSGTGYITNMTSAADKLTIPVTVPSAGNYQLVIRYNGPYGPKDQDIYVNGVFVSSLHFPETTGYTDLTAGSLTLNAGANTIGIYKNWGYTDFDKISLFTVPLHDYSTVAPNLIDANATPEAKALYNYIKAGYGTRIISGQTSDYYNTVSPNAAKKPVIRAYDFQHYTVGYSYLWNNATASHTFGWEDDGTTQAAIDWYNSTCQKGMVAFHWHWHSPSGGQPGTNTFYTNSTTFDVTKAVTQGTPEYTAVIRDIDSIATQLKRLQAAGVPVLWRPLHEAGGAWFWWGAKGPAAALALYDMVYNRIVNYHNIHNLIWQWSTPEANWYPGNSKVDMLGYDSYPGAYNYGTQKLIFDQLYTIVNGQKILAMTENGPIPDPDLCFSSDAKWAYVMSWSDLVTQQNSSAQLNLVYNHAKVLTLDEVTTATNTAQLTAAGTAAICTGGSVLLKANTAKGYTYKWYNGTNLITGATSSAYTATTAGSYTVTVTATGACTTTSAPLAVTSAMPAVLITPASATTFCQGENVKLNASTGAGYTYQWKIGGVAVAGSTSSSYTATSGGSYTVEVTSGAGCKETSPGTDVVVTSPSTWYADTDGDGAGDPAVTKNACAKPANYVATAGDACPNDANKTGAGNCGCNKTEASCLDCMGVPNGTAALDVCNQCAGGTSDITPKTNISQCTTTSAVAAFASTIKMYPNPTAVDCHIQLPGNAFNVVIYNGAGTAVFNKTFENEAVVGAELPQGIYLVRIEQDGNIELKKLIKE